jgi:dipeptidyl aminopeptidase/acylaminoacyl peptidase
MAGALVFIAGIAMDVPRAQERRPFTLVSLAEIPRVQDVQLSADGRHVSYMLARADWKANRLITHIWTQATAGGAPLQITNTDTGESLARWSPDGRALLFLARGDGGQQIFLVPAGGGASRQLTRHATAIYAGTPPAWSPDGASIYFLAPDPPTDVERQRERLRDDVFALDENYRPRHLWKVDVATGVEQKLTDGSTSSLSFRVSRDGTKLTVQRAPTPLAGDNTLGEVWVMDNAGGSARAITSNGIEELDGELSPDNSRVLFIADANERLEPYHHPALFVVDAAGGRPTLLLPGFPHTFERAAWADDRTIVAVVNMGIHSEIIRIDVAARSARPLTEGRHSVQFWSVSPAAGRMVFQLDEPTRIGDAWTLPVEGGSLTRVTGIYDALERDFHLPRQEKVTWRGADGVTIEGLLFYPIGYEPGRRYPLVVQLHGGPQESDKFGFGSGVLMNYMPVLTARGYAVLRPNYRGSVGYGDAFFRDVLNGYFRNMHLDVLAGVDALIKNGVADADRLAVMGTSAGGHLTHKLITVTSRFKAAASTAGVANWTSLFAQSDIRGNRTLWFGGLPWGQNARADLYWSQSPIKDAANVRTPTLLFAGQEDARVPYQQAVEMYRALRASHVPSRLHVAPREGHQWAELRHQLFKANAELEWFERHLMGRAHAWEVAPGDPPRPAGPGHFK